MAMKGYKRDETSKRYKYLGGDLHTLAEPKKTKDKKVEINSRPEPGPQAYRIEYKLAEVKPRGGQAAFGMTRDQFLKLEEQKKKKTISKQTGPKGLNDEVIANPRYDAVRPNQKKTAAVMRKPAEKKKIVAEAQKKLND